MFLNPGVINILTNTSYALCPSDSSGKFYPARLYTVLVQGLATTGATATTVGTLKLMNNAAAGTEYARLAVQGSGVDQWNFMDFSKGLLFPNGCWALPSSNTAYSTISYEVLPL